MNWLEFEYGYPQGDQRVEEWLDKALRLGLHGKWVNSRHERVVEALDPIDIGKFVKSAMPEMPIRAAANRIAELMRERFDLNGVAIRIIPFRAEPAAKTRVVDVTIYMAPSSDVWEWEGTKHIISTVMGVDQSSVRHVEDDTYLRDTGPEWIERRTEVTTPVDAFSYLGGKSVDVYLKPQGESLDPAEITRRALPDMQMRVVGHKIGEEVKRLLDAPEVKVEVMTDRIEDTDFGAFRVEVAFPKRDRTSKEIEYVAQGALPLMNKLLGVNNALVWMGYSYFSQDGGTEWAVVVLEAKIPLGILPTRKRIKILGESDDITPSGVFQSTLKNSEMGTRVALHAMANSLKDKGYLGVIDLDQTQTSGYGNVVYFKHTFYLHGPAGRSSPIVRGDVEAAIREAGIEVRNIMTAPHYVPQNAARYQFLPQDPISKGYWLVRYALELGGYPIGHKDEVIIPIGPRVEKPEQI
jgi:hypothetical protein